MADFTILDFPEITDPLGLKLYIVSDLADFHITYENLNKEFTDYYDQAVQTELDQDKNSSYTKSIDADTKLESIDITHVSGTPTVRVGTSLGDDDVMRDREPVTGDNGDENSNISRTFKSSTTLYITISGGTVSIKWNIRNNYNYTI